MIDKIQCALCNIIVIGILAFGGLVNFVNGQIYSPTEPATSLIECYSKSAELLMMGNMLFPIQVNITDPDIKLALKNLCLFNHEKIGSWELEAGVIYELGDHEFLAKYYPNGVPDSVHQLLQDAQELSQK